MRTPNERLQDILDSIENVSRYYSQGRAAFDENELVKGWFVLQLQIIGEASRTLPKKVREMASDVPWAEIIAMRNLMAHQYFGVDFNAVWRVAVEDLPLLKQRVEELLAKLNRT